MKKIVLIIAILCAIYGDSHAQVTNRENYDIKAPKDTKSACKRLYDILEQVPLDVRFGTQFVGDSVFLIHNDAEWLTQIIPSKSDGFAIDLVQKQQFQCDNISRFPGSWSHRGFLLPPIYRDDVKKRMTVTKDGFVMIYMGNLPHAIKSENAEANYLVLDNKNLCVYTGIVNVDFHGWKPLDTGLFYDTLSSEKLQEKYKELNKTLRFTIPFEKNKAEYRPEDIRPLYDSLHMTDYAIKTISIKAYTSVEGSYERNEKLQHQRAQSIVTALQGFQSEKIQSTITASENWVEFLNDIAGTGYNSWITLSKDEIKEKLKSQDVLNRIEPVLREHRKAIIEITLEKRLSYKESNPEELKKYFQQTIAQKNIDEALYLQQIIFYKIQRQEIPEQFIDQLEVPQSITYGGLLINNASFLFENDFANVIESIKTFEELDRLLPNNAKIRYNLCALRLQSWLHTDLLVEQVSLKKEIESLRQVGIHTNLIRRLMINYHIILSEVHMRNHNYLEKDRSLKFIYEAYKPLLSKDEDLVNLAKYFSHYSKFEWSKKVLEPRIKALGASEDLIFYYLSLTIFDQRYTSGPSYRTTMLNAINGNKQRFCELFNASGEGGISFQLLDNAYLKKTFCENCK